MGNKIDTSFVKTSKDAQDYFLKTTSRSVVIELHNLTATSFKYQDSQILHGDELLSNIPELIEKDTITVFAHGSNGFMTGCQAWVTYLSQGGIMMKILWESDYIGVSCATIETNNYSFTKTELEGSTKNNLYLKIELQNIDF